MFEISDLLDPETINKLNSLQYGKETKELDERINRVDGVENSDNPQTVTPGIKRSRINGFKPGVNQARASSEVVSNNKC